MGRADNGLGEQARSPTFGTGLRQNPCKWRGADGKEKAVWRVGNGQLGLGGKPGMEKEFGAVTAPTGSIGDSGTSPAKTGFCAFWR